ncbi:Plasmolipin [Merluccius polli]|uniref:Plasmolipin n=1 Tax=Merluccius polli TaxID=89951 RepID=A0AA47MBR8_MERPO|nr:Plasmolipin [Merluccius polli]
MAEFPSKVTTETSSPQSDGGQQGGNSLRGLTAGVSTRMDMSFIRSIPAILMMVEIVSGFISYVNNLHLSSAPYGSARLCLMWYTSRGVSGLLQWTLIAGAYWSYTLPAYGWVMFVAVTLWLLTTILFCLILFGIQRKLVFVPWPLTVMLYNAVAAILCLTAFLANAASVHQYHLFTYYQGHYGAAAFFGAVATVAYGASAYFSYLDWKGDGGNAASGTVPS